MMVTYMIWIWICFIWSSDFISVLISPSFPFLHLWSDASWSLCSCVVWYSNNVCCLDFSDWLWCWFHSTLKFPACFKSASPQIWSFPCSCECSCGVPKLVVIFLSREPLRSSLPLWIFSFPLAICRLLIFPLRVRFSVDLHRLTA
jgi:hypothetical protein